MSILSTLSDAFISRNRNQSRKARRRLGQTSASDSRNLRTRVYSVMEMLEARQLLTAMVSTDQLDYAPGSTANITANNDPNPGLDFQTGETVQFRAMRINPIDGTEETLPGSEPWRVADGVWSKDGGDTVFAPYVENGVQWSPDLDKTVNGTFQSTWYVDPVYVGATIELTATGLDSGAVAKTQFTDGNVKVRSNAAGITFDLDWIEYISGDGTGQISEQDADPPVEQIGFSGGDQFNITSASNILTNHLAAAY
jgi:hypothetical protein